MTYDYVIGIDVGKYFHHACVLDKNNKQVYSKRVDQSQRALHELFTKFTAKQQKILVAVDQPNNIGRLTIAVANSLGIDTTYLPGLAMRQLSRLHTGNAKTDSRDAYIIAHSAKNIPEALRAINHDDEIFQQLKILDGIDEDLSRSYTRLINQIRAALVGSYPEFEQVLRGNTLHRPWILHLLAQYGGPTNIKRLGKAKTLRFARKHKARNPQRIIDAMFNAIKQQTITLPGATYAELGIKMAAQDALQKIQHRKAIQTEVANLIEDLPHTKILLSLPGVGMQTAARILMTVGDMSAFLSAAHLASYAGLSPRTNQSGTSIMSNGINRAGNKKLKNALWQSAFASIRSHERSRQFYEKKRAEGKRHNAAVVALARRRLNVLYAMMRNREFFREIPPEQPAKAA